MDNSQNGNGAQPKKRKKKGDDLTLKEQRWLEVYLQTGNATEAARRAYDCTEDSARRIGAENAAKLRIQKRIEARIRESRVEANEVIGTLASHMRSDITEFFDESGTIDLDLLRSSGLGHLIKKIKRERRWEGQGEDKQPVDRLEIELHNPQVAAIQLCKLLGLEQQPRENEQDQASWREFVTELAAKYRLSEDRVKADLIAARPETKQWIS